MCNFGIFCLNLVVMLTSFAPLKIRIAYFNSLTPNTLLFTGKISRFLAENWNQCNFGWFFCLNFVDIATVFHPLKIWIVYLNSPTLKTLLFTQKISQYFIQKWNLCNFCLFLPQVGCHGNAFCSLKNLDSIFEFYNPKNPIIYVKIVTISCTELKSVHFFV